MADDETHEEEQPELRVVDDEGPSAGEEVYRLEGDEVASRAEPVARVEPPAEPHVRLEGAGPEYERRSEEPGMEAILDQQVVENDPESGWQEALEEQRPVPYGWFVLIFLLVAGGVVTAVLWPAGETSSSGVEEAREASAGHLMEDEMATREAERLVAGVEAKVREYANAGDINEMLQHVRDPERVEPLMRDWYAERPFPAEREFERMVMFRPLNLSGDAFHLIRYTASTLDEPDALIVEELGGGGFAVDWETDVKYQPVEWTEYVETRPEGTSMVFRVKVKPDYAELYSHEYRDEETWEGYELNAPRSEEFLIGYVKRGSELSKELRGLLERNRWQQLSLCLRLRLPEGTESPRGVEIEEVVSERWLIQERGE